MKCPFCLKYNIEVVSGKTSCPKCRATFTIDDRGECVFIDTDNPRIPVNGTFCSRCGLVQSEEFASYFYCGRALNVGNGDIIYEEKIEKIGDSQII